MPLTFDHLAPIYDHFMLPFERGVLKRWREMLWRDVEGRRILEVGVGTGANLPFYPKGVEVFGLDRSRKMLLKAKGKGLDRLVLGEIEALPFANGVFDGVVSTLVFCSVRDPLRGLGEIRRVLREGGRLYMLEHVRPEDFKGPIFDLLNPITVLVMEEYINRRTHILVADAGFSILKEVKLTSDGLFRYVVARK